MIHFSLPGVPISMNHAYENIRRRVGKKTVTQRVLTQEGKAYKNETKTFIARNYPGILTFFKRDAPYTLVIEFIFQGREELCSSTWPERAENRYKQLDVSNRVKLFEDALAAATGVDDRHNFSVTTVKSWHRDYSATNVWVWNREEERSPIDELVRQLKDASPQPHRAVSNVSAGGVQSPPKSVKGRAGRSTGRKTKRTAAKRS